MRKKVLKFCKSSYFKMLMTILFMLSAFTVFASTNSVGTDNSDELEDVWGKIASLFEGTGGKLAAIGIIVMSVWNREKIGIPYMMLGIITGILIPSLPGIIDSFSFTI